MENTSAAPAAAGSENNGSAPASQSTENTQSTQSAPSKGGEQYGSMSVEDDGDEGSGGSSQESSTSTSTPSAPTKETYDALLKKMEQNPDYDPNDAEMEAYRLFKDTKKNDTKVKDDNEIYDEDGDEMEEVSAEDQELDENGNPVETDALDENGEPVTKEKIEQTTKSLEGTLDKLGAKNLEEVPAKVDNLLGILQKYNSERAQWGQAVTQATNVAKSQHEMIRGLVLGDPAMRAQAIKLLSDPRSGDPLPEHIINGSGQPQTPPASNEDAEFTAVLEKSFDPESVKFLKSYLDKKDEKYNKLLAKHDQDMEVYRQVHAEQAAKEADIAATTSLATDYSSIVASAPELFPGLKPEAVKKAVLDYYNTGIEPKGMERLWEIGQIMDEYAEQHKAPLPMKYAFAAWKEKNAGKVKLEIERAAKKKLIDQKPTKGLANAQAKAGNTGTFTRGQIKEMIVNSSYPDKFRTNGSFDPSKVPAGLMKIIREVGEELGDSF